MRIVSVNQHVIIKELLENSKMDVNANKIQIVNQHYVAQQLIYVFLQLIL